MKFETLLKHFELHNPNISGTFLDCIIRMSSECWMVTCSTKVTHETCSSKGFTSFNSWSGPLNAFFDP